MKGRHLVDNAVEQIENVVQDNPSKSDITVKSVARYNDNKSYKAPISGADSLLVKSNILHIDGMNLNRSSVLELHPEPFTVRVSLGQTTLKALTHTDSRNDLFSQYVREIIRVLFVTPSTFRVPKECPTMLDTVWFTVKKAFKFQNDSMYNQMEDVTHTILNMCLREVDSEDPPCIIGSNMLFAVAEEYHAKIFDNYQKWCDYMCIQAFPWSEDPVDNPWEQPIEGNEAQVEIRQMMTEVVLFKVSYTPVMTSNTFVL